MKLLLDWDGPNCRVRYEQMRLVLAITGLRPQLIQLDRTAHGWHCIVWLRGRNLSPLATVALQAMCGSDPKREAFNFRRVRRLRLVSPWWRERWNVLYVEHQRGIVLNVKNRT
jgi:hypothetical protein